MTQPAPNDAGTGACAAAGAIAGIGGGIVSGVPAGIAMVLGEQSAWGSTRAIATIVGLRGGETFDAASLIVGGSMHLVLSALYGVLMATVLRPVRPAAAVLAASATAGLLLYAVNFHIVAPLAGFDELLESTSAVVEVPAHALYGLATGWLLLVLRRRSRRTEGP